MVRRTLVRQLEQLKPRFFSVTFGAGGSTREGTLATVLAIKKDGFEAAPHLTCIGSTRESIKAILEEYKSHGIRHLVALRGDIPSGTLEFGDFRYASELIAYVREQTGDWFHIECACYPEVHPQAKSPQDDLLNFKRKVLQCDPTAGYGCLVLRDRVPSCAGYAGKVTHAVNVDPLNLYSTYVHEGLPPGPIANPGIKSLQAVLAPGTAGAL